MNIYCLIEDHQVNMDFGAEHGVSFYIETKKHKVLFDVGQSALFLSNAHRLNIDIQKVDTLVISHGHYDHGGGLEDFLRVNQKAKIYIQEKAFNDFYSMRKENEYTYIGLDHQLLDSKRFIKINGDLVIDDELSIINDVNGHQFFPNSNHTMYKKENDVYSLDDFKHEQSLLVKSNQSYALFAGCAHKGIINIIDYAEKKIGKNHLSAVLGGFHFKSRFVEFQETKEKIDEIAGILKYKNIDAYYTGHCTGVIAYRHMKLILEQRLNLFYPGLKIEI